MASLPIAESKPKFELSLTIEHCEFILVDDKIDERNSLKIAIHCDAKFSFMKTADDNYINGLISNIELTSSYGESRKEKMKQLLKPMEMTISGGATREEGMQIYLTLSDITMTLPPSIIRFINSMYSEMYQVQEDSALEKHTRNSRRKNIWEDKNIKDCKFWFMKDNIINRETITAIESVDRWSLEQELIVLVPVVYVSIVDENFAPLFAIAFNLNATFQNWSTNLEAECGMSLEMAYFNKKLNVWEPLLEPLEDVEDYKPWELAIHVSSHNEFEMPDNEHVLPPPKIAIAIVAIDVMNVTITKTFLEMYFNYMEDLRKRTQPVISAIEKPIYKCSFAFHNVLPYPIEIKVPNCQLIPLEAGQIAYLTNIYPGVTYIQVTLIAKLRWTCQIKIDKTFDELKNYEFSACRSDGQIVEMDLGVRTTTQSGRRDMSLYCPFWMVNKTGLDIFYKAVDMRFGWCRPCSNRKDVHKKMQTATQEGDYPALHSAQFDGPLMFTFNGKGFFKQKKACLKVCKSGWSEKFPIDTVGSVGRIVSPSADSKQGMKYEVSLTVQLSNSGLTKICTFTPFYLIDNRCSADVDVREYDRSEWIHVSSGKVAPFWPRQTRKRKLMFVRYSDTIEFSLAIPFNESLEAFAAINNHHVGVDVCVHVSEGSVVIELEDFQDGMAPALIINDTDTFKVQYCQNEIFNWKTLDPGKCVFFRWYSLTIKRILVWTCGNLKNVKDILYKDGSGVITSKDSKDPKSRRRYYWISFLDGRQRVLLFTDNLMVATVASQCDTERVEQQISIVLHGIGISLVNDVTSSELAFIVMTSSGLTWEYKTKRNETNEHFKLMPFKESRELEDAFVWYSNEKLSGKKIMPRQIVGNIEVDFELMHQFKPLDRDIRRHFQSAFFLQYKRSTHQQHIHFKINHMQIDNQLPSCVFPIIFAPVPPPISVVSEINPKPLVEVSYVARKAEHTTMPQVKYFSVLVQEMSLQLDQGTLNNLIVFFGKDKSVPHYSMELYRKDRELLAHDLRWYAAVTASNEQKAFYDSIHFSPLKLHLSFSQSDLSTVSNNRKTEINSEFLNLMLKSFGVTLTEIQDVVFKFDDS